MDDIIKMVSEKAGISQEQAKVAVTTVLDFIKTKVPMVGDHLKGFLGGSGGEDGGGANAADTLKKKFGF